jgi:hypothetical protein
VGWHPNPPPCGTFGVNAGVVNLARDGRLFRESLSGWSESLKRWRGEGSCSSGRLGRLGRVGPFAPWKRVGRWALFENGSPADPLGRGEPPIVSSSPRPSRKR